MSEVYPPVVYEEIRIDVRDPLISHFYVACRIAGVVQWHRQSFPASRPVLDVVKDWQLGFLHPCDWTVVADTCVDV